MNTKVWEASGHLKEFSDPLVECKKCHHRFRKDLLEKNTCPDCGGELTEAKQFNLMLKTFLGPIEDDTSKVYFRPETAQAMFVDFKNVLDTTRRKLPFGIAQIGKAFRNEITPGNFIFRTREFEQMEIEYFIKEENWKKTFEEWRKEMWSWMTDELGLDKKNIHELDVPDGERAHYSKKTIDFEYDYPFGKKELYGLAYRTDFDLKNHFKEPPYEDIDSGTKMYPHVIEPTWGVDRSVLAVLCQAYAEEQDRVVLKLKPKLAPYKVAVFPLLKNKPELVKIAKEVYAQLKEEFTVVFDDRGNIGKRYYSQDEIGTPICITVDFDTLENKDVTLRDRDTMEQERVKIDDLVRIIKEKLCV
jgi:glycyl-tRNA synthetase